ncbi:copper amine oxidase N-terminal domain-containing protein [Lysinibacillus sp. NPDC097214]|uniref:copper amine oxidase N-terminal domain-containing protein n=1 Tax=Lysinibacillus sp. NPDC097214 TaxID=3390584 RepID=UPI003D05B43D
MVLGVTLVPLQGVFETLDATVNWNAKDKTITTKNSTKTVWLMVGSKKAKINGNPLAVSVAPIIKSGITLVPLRFISEALGATVSWDQDSHDVSIYPEGSSQGERSHWLGYYYNSGFTGSGVETSLRIDKVTPTKITFTSVNGYRYDPTNGNLFGYQMPWHYNYTTRDAQLISDDVASYELNGFSIDLVKYYDEIHVENMYGSCNHLGLAEYEGEYTEYRKVEK